MTKNTPYELSLVVLVKNWFRVVSVNNNGVRKVCREVFFAGACAGACAGSFRLVPRSKKTVSRSEKHK